MKTILFCAALSAVTFSAASFAQDAASAPVAIKNGAIIRTTDGHRVGAVDRVLMKDGQPASAAVIYGSHFIYIPASTLSQTDKGLTTSLTQADIAKMH